MLEHGFGDNFTRLRLVKLSSKPCSNLHIKLFLDKFLEENVEVKKSLNFAILEICVVTLCLSCLSDYYSIIPFLVLLHAHVSKNTIFKGF